MQGTRGTGEPGGAANVRQRRSGGGTHKGNPVMHGAGKSGCHVVALSSAQFRRLEVPLALEIDGGDPDDEPVDQTCIACADRRKAQAHPIFAFRLFERSSLPA